MAAFDHQNYINFIIDNGVVGFFEEPVTLKSGRTSHWYANWRTVAGDAYLLDKLSDYLIAYLGDRGLAFDTVYGVPEGATKLGVLAQFKWARAQEDYGVGSHVSLMGRGKPKEHGAAKDRFFLGEPKGHIVVVEDVTTTGGSLLAAIGSLKDAGADVVAAIGLTNRNEKRDDGRTVAEAVAELGVPYYAMSDADEFLPRAFEKLNPSDDVRRAVEDERRC